MSMKDTLKKAKIAAMKAKDKAKQIGRAHV